MKKLNNFTINIGETDKVMGLSLSTYLMRVFRDSDLLAELLVEKLEIQADSKEEAISFVKDTLIDIAAEDIGIDPDKHTRIRIVDKNTFRDKFYKE